MPQLSRDRPPVLSPPPTHTHNVNELCAGVNNSPCSSEFSISMEIVLRDLERERRVEGKCEPRGFSIRKPRLGIIYTTVRTLHVKQVLVKTGRWQRIRTPARICAEFRTAVLLPQLRANLPASISCKYGPIIFALSPSVSVNMRPKRPNGFSC